MSRQHQPTPMSILSGGCDAGVRNGSSTSEALIRSDPPPGPSPVSVPESGLRSDYPPAAVRDRLTIDRDDGIDSGKFFFICTPIHGIAESGVAPKPPSVSDRFGAGGSSATVWVSSVENATGRYVFLHDLPPASRRCRSTGWRFAAPKRRWAIRPLRASDDRRAAHRFRRTRTSGHDRRRRDGGARVHPRTDAAVRIRRGTRAFAQGLTLRLAYRGV